MILRRRRMGACNADPKLRRVAMSTPVVVIPSIRAIDARHIVAIPDDVEIPTVDYSQGSIKGTGSPR
jgi:hypothetical protein